MRIVILPVFLAASWMFPGSFSKPVQESFPMGKRLPVGFTLSTSNSCSIIVSGTVDESLNPTTFNGTVTLTGPPPCPTGTFTFTGRTATGSGAGGSYDYTLTFSHSSICSTTTIDWGASTGSDPDIAVFLNDYKTAMLNEIKEDAGCP